jgi:PIN like domain
MRVLLDENIPEPALASLRVLVPHTFEHVNHLGWSGRSDPDVFALASRAGHDVILALDRKQLSSAAEWRALKRAGLNHVSIRQSSATQGAAGSLRLMASLLVAMPRVLDDLAGRDGGCVVEVSLLTDRDRHTTWSYLEHERR